MATKKKRFISVFAAVLLIAITGDLIDSRNTNVEIALQFAEEQ